MRVVATKDKYILFNADCLDAMQYIKDESIDLILVDPPYGITANKWDTVINFELFWSEFERIITKCGVVLVFSSQPFTTKLIYSNITKFKYCWYWIKNQGTNFFHSKRMPIRKIEEINVFYGNCYYPQKSINHIPTNSSKGTSNGKNYHGNNIRNYKGGETTRFPINILQYNCVNNYSRLHPNQKPVDMLKYLILTYSLPGQIVLDNCMGSGSTGVAALLEGRQFIGIEKDKEYFEIARKRIKNYRKEQTYGKETCLENQKP
jgi:site-specific DNA-methyltransferase (adenine-specific)